MNKLFVLIIFLIGLFLFLACNNSDFGEVICDDNFKKARDLAYEYPNYPPGLDSAIVIANKCMECDSIRTAVVELKIGLLLSLGRFKEGSAFVDSLQTSDFTYPYKKKLYHDNFVALYFASNQDTTRSDDIFNKMVVDLEAYISNNNLKSKEFQEAFIDLNALKEGHMDTWELNGKIDTLKMKYPNETKFLDFFKQ